MTKSFPYLPPERFRDAPFEDVERDIARAVRIWRLPDGTGVEIVIYKNGCRSVSLLDENGPCLHVVGQPSSVLYGPDGRVVEDLWAQNGNAYRASGHERMAWLSTNPSGVLV